MHLMNRTAQLRQAIKQDVISKGLSKGDPIPSEREIAAAYSVSRVTVRRAIADLTEEGFLIAEGRRGTFINQSCDSLALESPPRRRILGALLAWIQDRYSAALIEALEDECRSLGYSVAIASSSNDPIQAVEQIERLAAEEVAGIVYIPVDLPDFLEANQTVLEKIRATGLPAVIMDRYVLGSGMDTVTTDNFYGAYRASEHLVKQGHTVTAFVTGVTMPPAEERVQGYLRCMMDHGIHPDFASVIRVDHRIVDDDVVRIAEAIRDSQPRPTAVFALYDVLAMKLWIEFEARGLKVPDDIAIVGYDNTFATGLGMERLTSVEQPIGGMGRHACRMLVDRITGYMGAPRFKMLESHLVLGESTRKKS